MVSSTATQLYCKERRKSLVLWEIISGCHHFCVRSIMSLPWKRHNMELLRVNIRRITYKSKKNVHCPECQQFINNVIVAILRDTLTQWLWVQTLVAWIQCPALPPSSSVILGKLLKLFLYLLNENKNNTCLLEHCEDWMS